MTEYREKLIDRMIRIYGFEHPVVIDFCRLCEDLEEDENRWNYQVLNLLVQSHEAHPVMEDEDED